ncbi:FtsX-like permease family protein [Conexibacter sp. DBS9H8]|uniref:ABC transporter permease n=1 Tax=Conexibacter sp. DBS9H8 TaxID=2937801 RepID=UPI00200F0378|nr:FtsX-like permease family protein [Conexibacter sp. DBS9H8]
MSATPGGGSRGRRRRFGDALRMLARSPRRALFTAAGVLLAAAMLSAAVVITDGLGGGFARASARADLGDLIIRFDPESARTVAAKLAALPDVSGFALRSEITSVGVRFGAHRSGTAVAEVLGPGRRQGFAVVAGHRLPAGGAPDVLVETAWAQAWGIAIGDELDVRGLGPERVVGYAEGPDDVGYPLGAPRFYLTRAQLVARFGIPTVGPVNFAEVWLRDPRLVDEVLVQARDESYGLRGLKFSTRAGVQVLISQAAGLVIDLLVALSVIALVTAAVMLGAAARAEVQRRLRSIGIRRALGAGRWALAAGQGLEVALVAVPAATVGTLAGFLATHGASGRLLSLLNEPAPGAGLILPLLGSWALSVAVPVLGAAWPAWRVTRGPVIGLLRGTDVATSRPRFPWPARGGGGLTGLGVRLVAARPARLVATVAMLASSTAFILLMIALAGTLSSLETDPQELGKRYELTAAAPAAAAARIARLPGVAAAEPRYELTAVDAYELGELVDVVAYPRQLSRFEAPPLAAGRRPHGADQAEVGVGLADALGLAPGSALLLELPSGRQLDLRVSGTVNSLAYEGLVAYLPAAVLLRADPAAPEQIAVLLAPRASTATVSAEMRRIGFPPTLTAGAVARGAPLVAVLTTILRAVAVLDGLVCLYALLQACALTVQERRSTVAVLRACGASPGAIARLLSGAVVTLIAPAAALGVLAEAWLLGPALARLAAGYASLDLAPTRVDVLAVLAGLALAGAIAVWAVTRRALAEPVLAGLAR